mgnify:CR=1 FL=1
MKKILSIGLALLCLSMAALGADTVVTSPNGKSSTLLFLSSFQRFAITTKK